MPPQSAEQGSAGPLPPATRAPMLDYATSRDSGPVTVARCSELAEAEMIAADLEAEGVRCIVTNRSAAALGAYAGGARVYVEVPADEADRAAQVLRVRSLGDDVEPADEDPAAGAADPDGDAPVDEQGRPVPLVVVAAYDRASRMRDAVTTLGAARIRCVVPRLVPRGDRPSGEGDRFVVRVRADDLPRARAILYEPDDATGAEDEDDEPRCPECASWRVHRLGSMWLNIGRFFGLAGGSEKDDPFQCLACGHTWPPKPQSAGGT